MKQDAKKLRYGWTTGSCATAAAKAAYIALSTGVFPSVVEITLPQGRKVPFQLYQQKIMSHVCALASVIKDAGDDPDVTHKAEIITQVCLLPKGEGIHFKAGVGVGTITKPGLPLPVGEPAINPVPRQMITQALMEVADHPDVEITISVTNGEELAKKTLNSRLGIVGGVSILGTTGIVVPFSCAAWIATIHRGIDVARAMGVTHLIASTGHSSEQAAQALYPLPESAFIEMGDFAGGVFKYIKIHPVSRLTIAGGIAKMTKLAQGHLDLHSRHAQVNFSLLSLWVKEIGGTESLVRAVKNANTVAEVFELCQDHVALGDFIAQKALHVAQNSINPVPISLEVLLFNRQGQLQGQSTF